MASWSEDIRSRIDRDGSIDHDEKENLKANVKKIEAETSKGKDADPNRLTKWLNVIAVMAPDIFDVAVTTLINPAAGLGLVVKKVGDRAAVEMQK
jgi:hypothetical protein